MRTHGTLALSVLTVLTGVTMAACGSDGSPDPTRSSQSTVSTGAESARRDLKPCEMLTSDEVAAALTQTAGERREKSGAGSKQCEWEGESSDRYLVLQVLNLLTAPGDPPDGYGWTRAAFDEYWSPGAQPLAGVGDAAYQLTEQGAGTIFVLDGELAFSLAVVFYEDGDAPAHDVIVSSLTPLATAITGRY